MRNTHRGYRNGLLTAAALMALMSSAHAQSEAPLEQAEADSETTAEEEIIITGSRIRRDAYSAPQPLIQIGGEDLIISGEPNIVDFLADIPALQGSQVPTDTTGAGLGDGGLSLLNLRQLGSARTLTLVDGRRHVGAAPGRTSVDVDSIPRLLIESVDVITGGASAVYGADAVSGVVNFNLKKNFEGIELDASAASLTQGFKAGNYRISALVGQNFLDDRLNTYFYGEFEDGSEVREDDLRIRLNDALLLGVDVDPVGAEDDGIIDRVVLAGNVTSLSRPNGGILTLAHDIRENGIVDGTNVPRVTCSSTSLTSGNCFIIDPGFSYQFRPDGTSFASNFGTFRDPTGTLRTIVQNGSGDPLTSFRGSRTPDTRAYRFQSGFNFEITPDVTVFTEGKYIRENTVDNFQPGFFDFVIQNIPEGQLRPRYRFDSRFQVIGLDNPFLDNNLRQLIENNRRVVFNSAGEAIDTVADPRAQLRVFTRDLGERGQENTRETYRGVFGARGDIEDLGILQNLSWELGYTYGAVQDKNEQFGTIDITRLANAVDAVVDTDGVLGTAGANVCRVQLLAAQGLAGLDPNDPEISECVATSIFGPGALASGSDYILTNIFRTNTNRQHDVLGFATADVGDFWGAGPITTSLGFEYRKESASGTVPDFGDRLLFANSANPFIKRSYDVIEGIFETRIPLLKDLPLVESLELNGAVRVSDYSTIGQTTVWNVSGVWQPHEDIILRGGYGVSVRAPDLDSLFSPFNQTFLQITDPCSISVINDTTDPEIQSNRIRNCAALGIPATYVDPAPGTSNPGRAGGNENLTEEKSRSYTMSLVYQPHFIENFSMVIDFFNIDISDAIASTSIQSLVNGCVDGDQINPLFCSLFSRDAQTFEIVDFTLVDVNFASLRTRGIDFAARYSFDLEEHEFSNWKIPGQLDFSIRGTYLLRRDDFINIDDPDDITELRNEIEFPEYRFLFTTSWSHNKLRISHDLDLQASQEIFEPEFFEGNSDSGAERFAETGRFAQHDITVTYDVNEHFSVRGGVINLFDKEPSIATSLDDDIFDIFGRRFFIGARAKF